jgi:hypothetical protein
MEMEINNYALWGGVGLFIVLMLLQTHLFVRPTELERKHKEIIDEVSLKYVSKEVFEIYRKDLEAIKETTSKIYELLINNSKRGDE